MNSNFKTYIINDAIIEDWHTKEEVLKRELSFIEYCAVKTLSVPESKQILILSDQYNKLQISESHYENFRINCIAWFEENSISYNAETIQFYYDMYPKNEESRQFSFNDCMNYIYKNTNH